MKRFARTAVGVSILLSCALPVRAQPTATSCDADARIQALDDADLARAAYRSGEFQRALALFEKAYAACPDPTLLYNIARVQERLGAFAKAIASYEEYLRRATNVPDRGGIEQGIRTLREKVAEIDRLAKEAAKREATATSAPPVVRSPPPNTTLPWVTLTAGLGGLVAAGVFGILAQREYGLADDSSQRDAVTHLDRGDTFRGWTIGLAASGAVLSAVGITWLWLSTPSDSKATALAGVQTRW